MKILNFTAIEILPALLSKAKVQTIRPAWDDEMIKEVTKQVNEVLQPDWELKSLLVLPRFKVGDKVKLLWQQRSKHKTFWRETGLPIHGVKYLTTTWNIAKNRPSTDDEVGIFNKLLGTAEITEVFKIEIAYKSDYKTYWVRKLPNGEWFGHLSPLAMILAKYDGFKQANYLFKFLDKKYDLSQPKAFWVYRWKWL